jgi:transcriptional regulator with XRE-family HTH domain
VNETAGITWGDGKQLLKWRKALGIGQVELAHAAGISQQLISFIETERQAFTDDAQIKLWGAITRLHSEREKTRERAKAPEPDLDEAAEHIKLYSLAERGKQLREHRRAWGIDLDYVARLARLTKSRLSNFERGRNDLRVEPYARLLLAIERVGEARAEVLEYVIRVKQARAEGKALLAELANPVPLKNPEELKAWIANETKDHIERRETQSFAETMKQRYEATIADLQSRIAELRDLLGLETDAMLKESERDELREKIKRGEE